GYLAPIPVLDFVPGPIWFVLKTGLVIFFLIVVRWTFPRLREDQLQQFAWKVLVPASLLNILVVGALKLTPWA
ncbi:MAG: NADH-quinone oxidoreductase subunit H, partial [Actinomycetota bacterium]